MVELIKLVVDNPLSSVGALMLLAGLFLLLTGLSIVKTDKVSVTPGRKTWISGVILLIVGIGFLTPDIVRMVKPTSSPPSSPISASSNVTSTPIPISASPTYQVKIAISTSIGSLPMISRIVKVTNPNDQVEMAKQAARFAYEGWGLDVPDSEFQPVEPPDWSGHCYLLHIPASSISKDKMGYDLNEEAKQYGPEYILVFHTDENCKRATHDVCEPNGYGGISGALGGNVAQCAERNWGQFSVEIVP